MKSVLKNLVNEIRNAGKYPGIIVHDMKKIKIFIEYGIKYIACSVDCEIVKSNYDKISKHFRNIIK